MTERRQYPRAPMHIPAKILLCFSAVDCTVRDLSDGGACLEVQNADTLPRAFDLFSDDAGGFRTCKVVWWQHDRLGVTFEWWWTAGEQAAA